MSFVPAESFSFNKGDVVFAIMRGNFGCHAGLGFHSAKDGIQVIHLATHTKLEVDPLSQNNCSNWIVAIIKLHQHGAKTLVGMLRAMAKKRPSIPYGIDALGARGSFNEKGKYSLPKGSTGLTCATFISEIFRAIGLPLINEETWEIREENKIWGEQVCHMLEKQSVDQDHITAVRKSINGIRVRPEELAAASLIDVSKRPVDYKTAYSGAKAVIECLDRYRPSLCLYLHQPH